MKIINNENFTKSNLDLDELEASICKIQQKYFDIKSEESLSCEDKNIKTIKEYIQNNPYIFISTYNHNDEILLSITQASWELTTKSYEDYENITNEDIQKISLEVIEYLKEL